MNIKQQQKSFIDEQLELKKLYDKKRIIFNSSYDKHQLHEAENTTAKTTQTLRTAHLNIQSIQSKLDELKNFLASQEIDIMLLSETWLNASKIIKIPNYNIDKIEQILTEVSVF